MWYTLKRAAVRIREDIAELNKRVMLGKEYSEADKELREKQLMLRHIENMRDKFGAALREARKSASKGYDIVVDVRNDVVNNDYATKEMYVYSIGFIENKNVGTSVAVPANSKASMHLDIPTDNSISQSPPNVNTGFSFSDNTGSRDITRAEAENRIIAIRMLEVGESAKMRGELAALREDAAKWQARAEKTKIYKYLFTFTLICDIIYDND